MVFAARAEGVPGHHRDVLFFEQPVCELLARKPRRFHRGEDIERPARLETGETEIVHRLHEEAAALVVLRTHLLHRRKAVFEAPRKGGGCGVLRNARRAQDGVLVYFQHGGVDLGRGAGEAHAPARHGERLTKPAEEHGALLHPGERGDRAVSAAVGELGVNFVGDDEKIVLFDEGDDGFELLLRHDAARGVVGVGEDDRLGAGGDRLFERFGREDKAVLRAAPDGDGRAAAQLHDGRVRDVGGIGDQNFIADIADGAESKVDALARPHRDDDVLGGIFHRKALFQVPRDEGAQLLKPAVARVLREAALQRADARRTHLPRGDEVGLADAEGDGVRHVLDDVEIFADAAGL